MTKKKVVTVEADDFAQVISCLGFVTSLVGEALPESKQKTLCEGMGNDLIELLLKYADDEKQEFLLHLKKVIMTEEADTSVAN